MLDCKFLNQLVVGSRCLRLGGGKDARIVVSPGRKYRDNISARWILMLWKSITLKVILKISNSIPLLVRNGF